MTSFGGSGWEDLNSFRLEKLEKTIRMPSNYVDEDYPIGPEIQ